MSVRDKIVLLSALIVIVGGALIINGRFNAANKILQSQEQSALNRPNTFPKQLTIKDPDPMADTRGPAGIIKSFTEPVVVDIKPEPVPVVQQSPVLTPAAQNIETEAVLAVRAAVQAPNAKPATVPAAAATTGETYTVQKGQTLTDIAIAVYNDKANAVSNAQKIYEFNKDRLKSMHQIKIGQKLRIPPIEAAKTSRPNQYANNTQKSVEKPQDKVQLMSSSYIAAPKEKENLYVVKKGDNLWAIAQKVLGNGSRYKEIVEANKELSGKEKLSPGMAIIIPNS